MPATPLLRHAAIAHATMLLIATLRLLFDIATSYAMLSLCRLSRHAITADIFRFRATPLRASVLLLRLFAADSCYGCRYLR